MLLLNSYVGSNISLYLSLIFYGWLHSGCIISKTLEMENEDSTFVEMKHSFVCTNTYAYVHKCMEIIYYTYYTYKTCWVQLCVYMGSRLNTVPWAINKSARPSERLILLCLTVNRRLSSLFQVLDPANFSLFHVNMTIDRCGASSGLIYAAISQQHCHTADWVLFASCNLPAPFLRCFSETEMKEM